jgi:hypothetical protein
MKRTLRRPTAESMVTFAVVAGAALFVVVALHPSKLVSNTTPAGGDMGAHVWAPNFLRHHLFDHFRLTGWSQDWYAGFPALTFYFPLPYLVIALLSFILPYGVAFKLVSIAGLVGLPVAAWAFGRLMRLPFPAPALLTLATVPYLFDRYWTIYGGNIASTLAGEFAFSISLALALVFLGVFSRCLETGRYRGLAGALLAATLLCHLLPALFAAVGALVLVAISRPSWRRLVLGVTVAAIGMAIAAFWLLPFAFRLGYSNDMGWERMTTFLHGLFPFLNKPTADSPAVYTVHLKLVVPLAAAGAVGGLIQRRKATVLVTGLGLAAAAAFRFMPQAALWNARMLPFWYLCLYLAAALGLADGIALTAMAFGHRRAPRVVGAPRLPAGAGHPLDLDDLADADADADPEVPDHRQRVTVGAEGPVSLTFAPGLGDGGRRTSMTVPVTEAPPDARQTGRQWGHGGSGSTPPLQSPPRPGRPGYPAEDHGEDYPGAGAGQSVPASGLSPSDDDAWMVGAYTASDGGNGSWPPPWPPGPTGGNHWAGDLVPHRAPALVVTVFLALLVWVFVGHPISEGPPLLPFHFSGAMASDRSFVRSWANWNYSGYQGKASFPEYQDVVDTMAKVGKQYGCGRSMWEYESEEDRFGTPMALMLLPMWTNGCIGSMEGLYFESSATVPYHFLNQSELSAVGSDPMRGLPYQGLDVADGIAHLRMLGVRYYMAISPQTQAQAAKTPGLTLIAKTSRPYDIDYTVSGVTTAQSRQWEIYLVSDSATVAPLTEQPVVMTGAPKGGKGWIDLSVPWYQDPTRWDVLLAASGPPEWKRVKGADPNPPRTPVRPAVVTNIKTTDDRISFDVDQPGTPVEVKTSYFPNWQATGARGPWRVTPNLMVVIPTSTHVELHYGFTPVDNAGRLLSIAGLLSAGWLWSRPPWVEPADPGPVGAAAGGSGAGGTGLGAGGSEPVGGGTQGNGTQGTGSDDGQPGDRPAVDNDSVTSADGIEEWSSG